MRGILKCAKSSSDVDEQKRNKYRLNIANTSMAIVRRMFSIGMGGLATASIPRISIAQQSRLAVGVVGCDDSESRVGAIQLSELRAAA